MPTAQIDGLESVATLGARGPGVRGEDCRNAGECPEAWWPPATVIMARIGSRAVGCRWHMGAADVGEPAFPHSHAS